MIKLKNLLSEGHSISFSKEEMAKLHKDGQIDKDGHTYIYKEGKITEKTYRSADEMGGAMRVAVEDFKKALKKADRGRLGPEGWAEKYHRSASNVIDQLINLTKIFGKM